MQVYLNYFAYDKKFDPLFFFNFNFELFFKAASPGKFYLNLKNLLSI
jgi:hypothetical protein